MKEFNFEKELLSVQDELFRFAYKLTADREKAEDLLQDTLLKAMLHKESYNKNTNFKGWLFIIMRNTFINGYRAEVGHTRLYISSDPAYYSRIMDESRTEEVDRNYDLEKIRNAIKSIPESHFIPFEMYLYNPQIQISAESETKRSIFREKDKTKRSKKESAQHSKSRNKSFVMTSVSAL